MKHAIFGDVGGHFGPLKRGLKNLGVNMKTLTIPEGLTIVQVGDLIHKGPNSALIVETVDKLMKNNPDQWIQLAGNHELPYTMGHRFFSRDRVDLQTAATLREWKDDGKIRSSYAFTSSTGQDYLVTHAGLTRPNYLKFGAGTASEIDVIIQSKEWSELVESGCILGGGPNNYNAGIFWAAGVTEVYASWYNAPEPSNFHQIHGHTTVRNWKNGLLQFMYGPWLTDSLDNDFENMHTRYSTNGDHFYAIDHDLGRQSFSKVINPLIIE